MKKVIVTIALMVVVLFLPSISEASWELVYEHQNGIRVYVDSATCRTIEGGLEVRTRRVIPASVQAARADDEAYSDATYQFNPSAHTVRLSNIQFYNKNGQFYKTVRDSGWEPFAAENAIEAIHQYAAKAAGDWKTSAVPVAIRLGAPIVESVTSGLKPPLQTLETGGDAGAGRQLIGVYQHSVDCPIEIYQAGDGILYGAYFFESPSAGRYYGAGKDRTDITLRNFRKVGDNSWLVDTYLYSTRYPSRLLVQDGGVFLDIIDLGSYFYNKIK